MGGAENVAAAAAEDPDAIPDLAADILHGAEWQGGLYADAALEAEAVAVRVLEGDGFHAAGAELERLENIYALVH